MNEYIIASIVGVLVAAFYGWHFWPRRPVSFDKAIKTYDDGNIPRDYSSVMSALQAQANNLQERAAATDDVQLAIEALRQNESIQIIRTNVGMIRLRGFDQGRLDKSVATFYPEGAPYPKGSGAAQQWVRGYCAGQGVIAMRPYFDAA